jgi:surfeit locus 1 family protein
MLQVQFKHKKYQFKPTWLGVVIVLICIPLFIKLGLWQYTKATIKSNIQASYQLAEKNTAITFPVGLISDDNRSNEDWKYKKVKVSGTFEPKYQLLLDNQVEDSRAGYHVITPLKIKNSEEYVLINRGWIPANTLHSNIPNVETPLNEQEVVGQVWVPSKKFFTLEKPTINFAVVWQNMDLVTYKKMVPMKVSALMIKLDKDSVASGFVRNWEVPQARITTHLGYAYQWFGFAIATFLIFLVMSFKEACLH